MILYLMRHGETAWNREGRLQGQSDVPLNEFGMELARRTAEAMREIRFDAVFSSPLDRALTTARTVAGDRGVPVVTDDRLKEIYFGLHEGARFDLAKRDREHPLHNFFCRPERYIPTDGAESFDQVRARAGTFFRERILPLEGVCEAVLIVAHGAFNRCVVNEAAGIPDRDFWRINLPNCAVSILALKEGRMRVVEESRVYYDGPVNGRP